MPTTIVMSGPGTATLVDDAATAIIAQTAALTSAITAQTLVLKQIQGTLANVTSALSSIADNAKASSGAITSVAKAVGGASSAVSDMAVTNQAMASSVIKKNNFDTEVVSQTLTQNGQELPKLPSQLEQLKSQLKEGVIMSEITKAENFVKDKINGTLSDATEWAKKALGVDQVIDNVKKQADAIITPSIKSPESIARDAAAAAGYSTGV
jgi:hypothetical protein